MRFQAVERVSSADLERVLIVLEQQLRRRIGGDVERDGARIALAGLGPSPRTINPRDRTVIDVRVEDGAILIEADVVFQASALAGPVGQEEIVRSKLQRVLRATKQQLEEEQDWLETERRERFEDASEVSSISSSSARIYTGPQRPFEMVDSSAHNVILPVFVENAAVMDVPPAPAPDPEAEEAPIVPPLEPAMKPPVAEVKDKALPEVKAGAEFAGAADNAAMGQQQKSANAVGTQEHLRGPSDAEIFGAASDEQEARRGWVRWAVVAACVAGLVPFGLRMLPKSEPAPVIDLTHAVSKPATPAVESGPEGALRQWELALRSADAGSQTAYYSVPVDQYMWKRNVNRRDLQSMKQQEIARRRGLWTVKLEDVNIQRKDGEADVTLVKHTMEQPQDGGKVRERFIHTQMTLKNSLGIWWITSERDIYPKKMDALEDNFNPDEGETPSWAKPAPTSVAADATPSSSSTN